MNLTIVYKVIFAFLCILQLGYAIKCYICNSQETCRFPHLYECNQAYANETSLYLSSYGVIDRNLVSNKFECLQHTIGDYTYKGCVYANINSCAYMTMPRTITTSKCYQCNSFNGCNPADRQSVSIVAITISMIFVLICKHFI